jgi:hypothetical protein
VSLFTRVHVEAESWWYCHFAPYSYYMLIITIFGGMKGVHVGKQPPVVGGATDLWLVQSRNIAYYSFSNEHTHRLLRGRINEDRPSTSFTARQHTHCHRRVCCSLEEAFPNVLNLRVYGALLRWKSATVRTVLLPVIWPVVESTELHYFNERAAGSVTITPYCIKCYRPVTEQLNHDGINVTQRNVT